MTIPQKLVPSADHHAEDLNHLVGAFVHEVGYYFGRTRDEGGKPQLPGLTDVPIVNPNRWVIELGDKVVGFVDWHPYGEEGGNSLGAVYVSARLRRQKVASRALRQLFGEHPGTWSLTMSPRFGPGETFVSAMIQRFGRPGTTTKRIFNRGNETFHRVTFSAGTDGVFLPPSGGPMDFEFDRRHHKGRRWILFWALVTPVLGLFLVASAAGDPTTASFLSTVVTIVTVILWAVYVETVVTGILDRQDRGPIVKPYWIRTEPKDS